MQCTERKQPCNTCYAPNTTQRMQLAPQMHTHNAGYACSTANARRSFQDLYVGLP